MFLGLGLALGNWLSLIIFLLEICYVYSRRVQAEEKALLGTLGEPYRAYMARTNEGAVPSTVGWLQAKTFEYKLVKF